MNELQKCAEILVECGYAKDYATCRRVYLTTPRIHLVMLNEYFPQKCAPFSDTLEGRRQADAIENYLHINYKDLIITVITTSASPESYNGRQKRLERIKWCIQQLIEGESDDE